jgi:hypothetical protein
MDNVQNCDIYGMSVVLQLCNYIVHVQTIDYM